MELIDAYDIKPAMRATAIEEFDSDDVFLLAASLAEDIQGLFVVAKEQPRWEHLYDQCLRASNSIVLNYAEGIGKIRGYTMSAWLVARGEAYELYGGLSIGNGEFRAIKPKCRQLIALLNGRIMALHEKSDKKYWQN